MARQSFNAGMAPSGIGGDTNKTINTKWDANFTELYKAMGAVFGGVNSGAPGAVLPTALPISNGGTGATTAASARSNLGLGALATLNSVSISNGGTGATTQVAAAKALLPAAATGQFLKYDGTNWIASADNNTTYSNMSTDEITAGTGTTGRLITPKDLKTAVDTYNAATATKLKTPRKINGIDFDGTQDINFATLPLGVPLFHGGTRATIDTGYVPYDGQPLNRADYPAMWAKVQATFPIITDADWLANPSKRGSYSSGNGTTTFRMPDYNGVQTNSLKGLFLRGDGGGTIGGVAVSSGTTVLSDAIRNITGDFSTDLNGMVWLPLGEGNGAFTKGSTTVNNTFKPTAGYSVVTGYPSIYLDASLVVPTAAENRPVSAVGVWICRVGNATTEVENPTLHAVLTGGNTFSGSQAITGDLAVSGNVTINGVGMFGVGQVWYDMESIRSLGVTYTNTTGKTILLSVRKNGVTGALAVYVDTKLIGAITVTWSGVVVAVPHESSYYITHDNGGGIETWKEFR